MKPGIKLTFAGMVLCLVAGGLSIVWLTGHLRAIWPNPQLGRTFDGMLSSVTHPQIKLYTVVDDVTGIESDMKIAWFSMVDGPTGVVYAYHYFPSWIVSVVALMTLCSCAALALAHGGKNS